jgi:hypothetical protein
MISPINDQSKSVVSRPEIYVRRAVSNLLYTCETAFANKVILYLIVGRPAVAPDLSLRPTGG